MAIATYLIRQFDHADKFGLRNGDWIRDEAITSMALTNLQRATGFMLMLDFGWIRNGLGLAGRNFDGPELRTQLGVLEKELVEGPPGGFFMGENPGRADVMMEFAMTMVKRRKYIDLVGEFPKLDEWLQRVYNRPAFKRSLKKGNGYDGSVFPKVPRS
jgi:glutathione S-transferase